MQERDARHPGGIAALSLTALGVVFGDIGTSPLYTLKTVLDLTGDGSAAAVLGVLSMIMWTLIVITSIKYVTIAMRVDNDGHRFSVDPMGRTRRDANGVKRPDARFSSAFISGCFTEDQAAKFRTQSNLTKRAAVEKRRRKKRTPSPMRRSRKTQASIRCRRRCFVSSIAG